MKTNFGKYEVPKTLQTLMNLEKELEDREQFFDGLGFYLSLTNFRYFNTPCDVVVFGNIGADGIHYGFLTDYGSLSNLEEAPIVCVSPMDFDQPTRLIANNIREFLRANMTDAPLFYNYFATEERYNAFKQQRVNTLSTAQRLNETRIHQFLEQNIDMPIVEQPYQYMEAIRKQRQQIVSIETQDGLGVTAPLLDGETHRPFTVHQDLIMDVEALKAYFSTAPATSQLAVMRDIQLHHVLPEQPLLLKTVQDALISIGLTNEANRLAF